MICDVVTATMQRDAQVAELSVENDKLRALIQKLLRHRFGRRSEQLSPDQLKLAIEDIEQEIAEREAAEDASAQSEEARRRRRDVRPRRNLGALPAHLPRDEVVIDIDSKECPCCGGALHLIDETRTEMLDIVRRGDGRREVARDAGADIQSVARISEPVETSRGSGNAEGVRTKRCGRRC